MPQPLVLHFMLYVRRLTGALLTQVAHANAQARRGHEVHLGLGAKRGGTPIASIGDVPWIEVDENVHVHLGGDWFGGQRINADISFSINLPGALPIRFFQGVKRHRSFDHPWPIVCVSQWLYDFATNAGVPERRLVYVPNGLDHSTFKLTTSLRSRRPRIAMIYKPRRRPEDAFAVLEEVRRRRPDTESVIFTASSPHHRIPDWASLHVLPDRRTLVETIYNGSRVFLCTSPSEGFGRPSLEAMACGCALVTVDNGGSREFAFDGDTALVTEPGDVEALTDAVERLLVDDDMRLAIAERGLEHSRRFDWDRSGSVLDAFLREYRANPEHHLNCTEEFARNASPW